ncbi:MAG: DUF2235 domain-containing protein [Acidobacteria bacterium]|nr:DUF2235 domain-containing protein [Acidobacteriota bacterium]
MLVAFDGTWNTKKDNDTEYRNTNVWRFYETYHANSRGAHDVYRAGIGTRYGLAGRLVGGAFGAGELPRLNEAYEHVCRAWDEGDRAIDIIGFSRGAATALDFCNLIQQRGVRRPASETVVEPNATIRFLGLWDVVAAFGLGFLGVQELNLGHHLSLPHDRLEYCFHAMALDERRLSFLPTRLGGAYEVWFRGVHSDVGGGNANRGLNDIALRWMMRKAQAAGLPILEDDIAALRPDPTARPKPHDHLSLDLRLVSAVDRLHYTIMPLPGLCTPPGTCTIETEADERRASKVGDVVVYPIEVRGRIAALLAQAEATAKAAGYSLGESRDPLVALIQGRVALVTDNADMEKARDATTRLVSRMVRVARQNSWPALNDYMLTNALYYLRPLYPFTD